MRWPAIAVAAMLALGGCAAPAPSDASGDADATASADARTDAASEAAGDETSQREGPEPATASSSTDVEPDEEDAMNIEVNGHALRVALADNSSAEALRDLLEQGPVTVSMHDYGSFEKVGPLGRSLPTNDEPITTEPGDVILYQGDQVTIYYDVNSWNFTRLGHVENATPEELRQILGTGDVTATFSLEA